MQRATVRSRVTQAPVLVLNAAYEPISFASVQRAMKLLVKGKASIQIAHEAMVHEGFPLPSVVRLNQYRHIPHIQVMPRRDNIYLRDGHQCQYCGEVFPARLLTLDHVIPRARGGKSTWENLVACCHPCNQRKADKSPSEVGMTLLRKPRLSTVHTSRHMLRMSGSHDPNWRQFLYHN